LNTCWANQFPRRNLIKFPLLIETDPLPKFAEHSWPHQHAVALDVLPSIHKDPFDRILIAQAMVEGITLLTADPVIASDPGKIRKV
jgi:hypothetical protein